MKSHPDARNARDLSGCDYQRRLGISRRLVAGITVMRFRDQPCLTDLWLYCYLFQPWVGSFQKRMTVRELSKAGFFQLWHPAIETLAAAERCGRPIKCRDPARKRPQERSMSTENTLSASLT